MDSEYQPLMCYFQQAQLKGVYLIMYANSIITITLLWSSLFIDAPLVMCIKTCPCFRDRIQ